MSNFMLKYEVSLQSDKKYVIISILFQNSTAQDARPYILNFQMTVIGSSSTVEVG